MDGSHKELGGCRSDSLFKVFGQVAVSVQLGKGGFYDPTAGQNMEAFRMIGAFDDVNGLVTDLCQRLFEFASSIASIGEDVTEPLETGADICPDQRSAVSVLYIGSIDNDMDQIAIGIGDDMALAALDLLARIIAPYSAAFRGLDALAVDHTGAGRGLAVLRNPRILHEAMIDPLPCNIVAPPIEPALHGGWWRKARAQHPPWQPAPKKIQYRLDIPSHRPYARAARQRWRWQKRL